MSYLNLRACPPFDHEVRDQNEVDAVIRHFLSFCKPFGKLLEIARTGQDIRVGAVPRERDLSIQSA
ncbi:hypothetical protein E1B28_010980 [Marasmius oreades]|uniref:Uncharacterized protein n=1 Tax=Marasmius oreades TaxID=181124 RepID=A0A9P7UP23_9AGAR|nr:uncharacterized protein E1B28_010980 [Marasmius oreades]KAG7089282.1 hypothetical protein E1B28_010980 [Marasmius oreades]